MDRYLELKRELRSLREQSCSDFAWTVQALTEVRDRLQLMGETSQVIYDKLFDLVEEIRDETATKADIGELGAELAAVNARLEAIEKRLPAA